jgi:hypothetical protein
MNSLTEFLFPAPARRSPGAILAWWERRRLAYNAWVGVAGMASLAVLSGVSVLIGDAVFVGGLATGAAIFGVMANLCYLLGPLTEIAVHAVWGRQVLPIGPALFRMGLTFSVGLALFPAFLITIVFVVRVVIGAY